MNNFMHKIKSIFIILIILLTSSFLSIENTKSDVAPYQDIGGGSGKILCNQTDISMVSFFVNVTVDLPEVNEHYTYYLYNNANTNITQNVIIPIYYDRNSQDYYKEDYDAKLYVDGESKTYQYDTVDIEEIHSDLPFVTGFTLNITFEPNTKKKIYLDLEREFDSYTSNFIYIYSAKTGSYWHGNIEYGYFKFKYVSEYKKISYDGPESKIKGNKIISVMENWDGNSTYRVDVDTGIRYHNNYDDLNWTLILPIIGISILAITVLIIKFKN
ncbi:MAG: hypothetical protein R6U61_02775 [Thermoplasmata archaeon]